MKKYLVAFVLRIVLLTVILWSCNMETKKFNPDINCIYTYSVVSKKAITQKIDSSNLSSSVSQTKVVFEVQFYQKEAQNLLSASIKFNSMDINDNLDAGGALIDNEYRESKYTNPIDKILSTIPGLSFNLQFDGKGLLVKVYGYQDFVKMVNTKIPGSKDYVESAFPETYFYSLFSDVVSFIPFFSQKYKSNWGKEELVGFSSPFMIEVLFNQDLTQLPDISLVADSSFTTTLALNSSDEAPCKGQLHKFVLLDGKSKILKSSEKNIKAASLYHLRNRSIETECIVNETINLISQVSF